MGTEDAGGDEGWLSWIRESDTFDGPVDRHLIDMLVGIWGPATPVKIRADGSSAALMGCPMSYAVEVGRRHGDVRRPDGEGDKMIKGFISMKLSAMVMEDLSRGMGSVAMVTKELREQCFPSKGRFPVGPVAVDTAC